MKKKRNGLFIIPLLVGTPLIATSCSSPTHSSESEVTLLKIELKSEVKTTYHFGDSFVRPTVQATYSDGEEVDITNKVKISGFNSLKVGKQTVTLSYEDKSISYDITVINEVKELKVTGQKTSFLLNEEFNLGGGVILLVYDNEDEESLSLDDVAISGFDSSSTHSGIVTISYKNLTASYTYSVIEAVIGVSLAISNYQSEYTIGESFVRPTATLTLSDESTVDVSNSVSYSGFDSSKAGEVTITATYQNVSTTFVVTIKDEGSEEEVDPKEDTITGAFTITSSDGGTYVQEGNVYTINSAGTFTISGKLAEGQLVINAPDAEVAIEFTGVSIASTTASPVHVITAGDIDISAKKNKSNFIYDNRPSTLVDASGEATGAAIYVEDGDLKLKGKGYLEVVSKNNNGIHGKDDVTVKNLTLLVRAVNNGIKGNDSVTFEENPTVEIICGNDGVKTSNTDYKKDGVTYQGTVTIAGGSLTINSYGDGIDAAYDVVIQESEDEKDSSVIYTPTLAVYTYTYSSFKSNDISKGYTTSVTSYKGIKSTHDLIIAGGETYVKAYDDSVHGNQYSDNTLITYETGESALGNVTISGGKLECYTNDDGVHADGTLTITGGLTNVTYSNEGLEGHIVNISGGEAYIVGKDDGVNATASSSYSKDGQINISGGYLDVTVSSSGDVDGIDSNGTYTQTGGTVIVRGPANGGAWSVDTDSTVTLNGGTIIVVGGMEASSSSGGMWLSRGPGHGPGGGGGGPGGGGATLVVGSNMTKSTSSTGLAKGTFKVTIAGNVVSTYTNSYSYSGSVTIYSELGSASVSKIS